ncbi:MAG TPA: DPP IV N-terminal domain-containing protein [Blastocatellia bacterium]|nr:DPP IV N-terminal domain-containing protein [Blastocatellia bacterium]
MVRRFISLVLFVCVIASFTTFSKLENHAADDSSGPLIEDNGMIEGLAWTPDSRRVVMSLNRTGVGKGSNNLYQLDVASGKMTSLTKTQEEDTTPTISPDGRYVAFMRGPYSGNNIWVASLGDKRSHPVTHFAIPRAGADDINRVFNWSSDSKSLVMIETSAGFSPRVSSLGLTGTRRRLPEIEKALSALKDPVTNVYGLSSDSTGSRLAIFSVSGGKSRVLIVDRQQSNVTTTIEAYPGTVGTPRWSSDDRFIYVCADLDLTIPQNRRSSSRGKPGTFRIDASNGRVERVSEHYGELSPDGHKLLWEESVRSSRGGFKLWLELLS